MVHLTTAVGLLAALCTTVSYIPQMKKCWQTGRAGDLSLKMYLILATGIALWVMYGVLQGDAVIVLANSVSLAFLATILVFKLREIAADRAKLRQGATPLRPPAEPAQSSS
ncbi:SemiSWEET family sugar transporter [Rhodoplanes roseus]|uniref:Glutathione synthetase n=1 Tax=Rhodoplanes roseus TaxID=29409 RepID=A0A327L4X7_9BRAD|nr:SemiSWEET transporter [Rhodoplanes roseus]RAI45035.1 hypothetical protein CH341_06050 [Rhodoplanes roseus]